jgi:hypothetical protein
VPIRRWQGGFFILALGAKLKALYPSFRWDDGGNFTVAQANNTVPRHGAVGIGSSEVIPR